MTTRTRARFQAAAEVPQVGANHVRAHVGIQRDLQKADPGFTLSAPLFVGLEDASADPKATEDAGPDLISAVDNFSCPAQLNGRRREKPGNSSSNRHDQRHTRIALDIARLLQVSAGHDIQRDLATAR
jgi:hypothetical protein